MLRALKREFNFYCIKLVKEQETEPEQPEMVYVLVGVVNGELFVIGGLDSDNNPLSSVEKYSPSSNTWSAVALLPVARSHHTATAVRSAIYVLAGYCGGFIANVLKYDGIEDTWSVVAPIPVPVSRLNVSACAVGSHICVFGGYASLQVGHLSGRVEHPRSHASFSRKPECLCT
jgi:N-acetylneuraminic acid mutarotase